MKVVNYLDVNFKLSDGTYKPYTKPNKEIKYIHKNLKPSTKCHLVNPTIYRIKVIHSIF